VTTSRFNKLDNAPLQAVNMYLLLSYVLLLLSHEQG